jgi:hypothetical protein
MSEAFANENFFLAEENGKSEEKASESSLSGSMCMLAVMKLI